MRGAFSNANHLIHPPLQASSSFTPRIRKWPIGIHTAIVDLKSFDTDNQEKNINLFSVSFQFRSNS